MKKLLSAGAIAALMLGAASTGAEANGVAMSMQERCLIAAANAGIGDDFSVVFDAARGACVATPIPGTAAAAAGAGLGALGTGGAAAAAVGGLALIVAVASTGGT